ncbi:MAG: hypothetical protein ACI9QN_002684 [Arcticibacterium sp.]|jgi:hypothetical protein
MISILKDSFKDVKVNWPVHLFMYLVSILLAILPLIFFYEILKSEIGNSMLLNELVSDFSFMVFGDFMIASGEAFKPVFWYSLGAGFVSSLIYTFFAGGVIYKLDNPGIGFSFNRFFKISAAHFPKYFGLLCLTGLLLFIFFLISGLVYFVFLAIADGSSERGYVLWLIPPSVFLFILMSFGLCISFYAKVFMYKEPRITFLKAFWEAFYYVFTNKETLLYFWVFLIFGSFSLMIYLVLDEFIGMTSGFTIGLMLVFQQLFIFIKFVLKHWNYALVIHFFDMHPVRLYTEIPAPLDDNLDVSNEDDDKLSKADDGF